MKKFFLILVFFISYSSAKASELELVCKSLRAAVPRMVTLVDPCELGAHARRENKKGACPGLAFSDS